MISGLKKAHSKAIYEDLHARMEKWTELIHLANVKVTLPCVVIPKFVMSFYVYYTTDVGGDAFQLPTYAWLVELFRFVKFEHINTKSNPF